MNDPQSQPLTTDCAALRDITKWTPLRTSPTTFQNNFMGSSMARARPFTLTDNRQFLVPGPPMPNTARAQNWVDDFQDLIRLSAQLTDYQKVEIEFWTIVSGVLRFQGYIVQAVKNKNLDLATTVKALFVQGLEKFFYHTFFKPPSHK